MPKVLVVFYSRSGTTAQLAEAIAEGAKEAGASEVVLRRANDVAPEEVINANAEWKAKRAEFWAKYQPPTAADVENADVVFFGSPTRFGMVSADLKAFIDGLSGLWMKGATIGKVASTFSNAGSTHGGQETTQLSLYAPLAHLGFIIAPVGYQSPATFESGTPYGAASATNSLNNVIPEIDLELAKNQARYVVGIGKALKKGRETA
ncbi:MAG TPA: NAD(P)H:quinone oxidoreductase [Capsulimonadaceae bacterium]|jgi:NAD(P)H dehydrogenase (quinone)